MTLRGVIPILHSCWREDGSLDAESVGRQIDWTIGLGVDGLGVALATDILRMSAADRTSCFRLVVDRVAGRTPVVLSVGAGTAEAAMAFATTAKAAGAAAVMAIPPRGHAADDEILTYYDFIQDAAGVPVIVQDASSYVGRPFPADLQARIAERHGWDRIWFKPEADPVAPVIAALRDRSGGRAVIFEGSGGADLTANHALGIAGTMPGCDLLDAIVPLWRALEAGDRATADRLAEPVAALARLEARHGLDGYLAIERHLMHRRGLFASPRMRRPDDPLPSPDVLAEADGLFDRLRSAVVACCKRELQH